jgi:ABC-type transport system involved in multi-copper enzyme maturation permease subunit
MTALTSAIPAPAVRQNGLIRLVRVELLKIRATRLNYGLLGAAAAITALFAVLESARAGSGAPNTPASLSTPAGLSQVMTAGVWALMFAAVLGVTVSSGEFRHRTATLTYLAAPDRSRVLAAKAIGAALAGAVLGLAGFAVSIVAGLAFVAARGYPVSVGAATFADWGAGHLVGGALLAAIGVVIGTLVRSQLAGVIGVFVWAMIIESLIGGLFTAVRPYLPYTAATTLAGSPLGGAAFGPAHGVNGGAPLPFAAATALLAAIALAGGIIAARTTVRRDIT